MKSSLLLWPRKSRGWGLCISCLILLRLRRALAFWRGGQFGDGNVLELHQRLAAAMDLQADLPFQRNLRVLFGVVAAGDAIDPDADPRALRHDAVVVPVIFLQRGGERLFVRGVRDHPVPAALVVDFSPPAGARIALIAGHFAVVRHTLAADLDAAVDEPFGA